MARRIFSIELTPQDYEALQRVAERMETRRADVIRAAVRALADLTQGAAPAAPKAEPRQAAEEREK